MSIQPLLKSIVIVLQIRMLPIITFIIIIFRDDVRTANIICDDPEGVTCLTIEKDIYFQFISNISEITSKYVDVVPAERLRWVNYSITQPIICLLKHYSLNHLSSVVLSGWQVCTNMCLLFKLISLLRWHMPVFLLKIKTRLLIRTQYNSGLHHGSVKKFFAEF